MAADRAATMATTIHPTVRHCGSPPAASSIAVRANGSAKIECSHLIISSVVPTLFRIPILFRMFIIASEPCSQSIGDNAGVAPLTKHDRRPRNSSQLPKDRACRTHPTVALTKQT